jgi:hypothetical protein
MTCEEHGKWNLENFVLDKTHDTKFIHKVQHKFNLIRNAQFFTRRCPVLPTILSGFVAMRLITCYTVQNRSMSIDVSCLAYQT